MPEDDVKKMDSGDWVALQGVAILFDLLGWCMLLIDWLLLGWGGFFLNLIAGITFGFWLLLWKDKLGGGINLALTFLGALTIEEIPVVGDVLPLWTGMIYKIKSSTKKGGGITAIAKKLAP